MAFVRNACILAASSSLLAAAAVASAVSDQQTHKPAHGTGSQVTAALEQFALTSMNHTTVRSGDGYGGEGFVVDPVVSTTPTTVLVLHGLGSNGQEVGCSVVSTH
jgi:expansin (peptidoglycan-binding protein)